MSTIGVTLISEFNWLPPPDTVDMTFSSNKMLWQYALAKIFLLSRLSNSLNRPDSSLGSIRRTV
jgi:hypothetical protein